MKNLVTITIYIWFVVTTFFICSCSDNISGGTEIGNPKTVTLSGTLKDTNDNPVPFANIYALPIDSSAINKSNIRQTRSDCNGNYELHVDKECVYSITSVDTFSIIMAFSDSIIVTGEDKKLEDQILKPSASVTIIIDSNIINNCNLTDEANRLATLIYIQGTPFYRNLSDDTITLALPEGTFNIIHYDTLNNSILEDGATYRYVTVRSNESFSIISHNIQTPNKPEGNSAFTDSGTAIYTTGDSKSSLGHPIEFRFRWVKYEGQENYWDYATYGNWGLDTTISVFWPDSGEYKIQAQSRSVLDTFDLSTWSTYLIVNVE